MSRTSSSGETEYYYEEGEEEEWLEGEEEETAGETDRETEGTANDVRTGAAHDVDNATHTSRRPKLEHDAQHGMPPPTLEVEQGADSLQDLTDDSIFSNHGPPASAQMTLAP